MIFECTYRNAHGRFNVELLLKQPAVYAPSLRALRPSNQAINVHETLALDGSRAGRGVGRAIVIGLASEAIYGGFDTWVGRLVGAGEGDSLCRGEGAGAGDPDLGTRCIELSLALDVCAVQT